MFDITKVTTSEKNGDAEMLTLKPIVGMETNDDGDADVDEKVFSVSFGNSYSFPSCTCVNWQRDRLPCIHMFAVFNELKDDGSKWTISDMVIVLKKWKEEILEEIIGSSNINMHKIIFTYLSKENRLREILHMRSEFLENYLLQKNSEIRTPLNLIYLFHYYYEAKKDLNLLND